MQDQDEYLSKALAQYGKQFQFFPYEELPHDLLLEKNQWDLSKWTLIVTDDCLKRLIDRYDGSSVLSLDLCGASKVTDVGITSLSESTPNLSTILLENIFRITDMGLEKIAKNCNNINKLSLSGCLGISGKGFAILGQHSRLLVSLKLSGCRQVLPWSFMKIFEGCTLLEELDTSYCSLITDQEVKILANCCSRLQNVNLKQCCQISDIGILSLAQRCKQLVYINLARSDLVARITDVSLMAIGESCKDLKSINLSGCSKLSDAGISWLATGCKQLSYVNLTGCTNITNGGIRYIGDECSDLRTIVLLNAKKISDIGIRYLAEGCHLLESLNVSGLYMLSDGVQRDFAHEGIQSLGRSKCVKCVRKLNLHGCFQISKWALKAIASMSVLEHLVLSGCTKLTIVGLTTIAKSCKNITFLSFASCGNCITNSVIEVMTDNLCLLESLILSDCCKIGRKALIGISKCKYLKHLNLSGCKSITNEAILALCDGTYVPGIKELFIDRCHRVDDKALIWIIESLYSTSSERDKGQVSLTTLSMKGTKISLSSSKAVRERFRYSSLKVNGSFFGFWPMSRTEDRIAMNLHSSSAKSVTRIQAALRGVKGRIDVRKRREDYNMTKKATLISALWRGHVARKFVREYRHESWLRKAAVIKLQCFFRYFLAQNCVQRMKEKRWMTVAPYAATKIQKSYRGLKGRETASKEKKAQIILFKKKLRCCIKLQALFRQNIAKNLKRQLQTEKIAFERRQLSCCITIQSFLRMIMAIATLNKLKRDYKERTKREHDAGCCLLRSIRGMQFRVKIYQRVQYTSHLNSMSIKIQYWYRKRVNIERKKAAEKLQHEALRQKSAIIIEKNWRRKCAFMTLKALQKDQVDYERLKCKKSVVLTSWSRMCLARRQLAMLKEKRLEYLKQRFKIESQAATQIASCWRGHLGRSKARSALKVRKTRWKKMWSDEDSRYFFYNQITGESRWRIPQDLLDLEPTPICENCDYYEAKFECASCNEFFCGSCWDAVHFGGKRKTHKFRSLYDYYRKRIDYGEGEFPSIWPSEIEQDERLGWQLKEL